MKEEKETNTLASFPGSSEEIPFSETNFLPVLSAQELFRNLAHEVGDVVALDELADNAVSQPEVEGLDGDDMAKILGLIEENIPMNDLHGNPLASSDERVAMKNTLRRDWDSTSIPTMDNPITGDDSLSQRANKSQGNSNEKS